MSVYTCINHVLIGQLVHQLWALETIALCTNRLPAGTTDYVPRILMLALQSGPVCLNVTIIDDNILEDVEEFSLHLSSNDSAVLLSRNSTRILIPNVDSECNVKLYYTFTDCVCPSEECT